MTEQEHYEFFVLLNRLINEGNGTWREKKEGLLALASDQDRTNLEELASWMEDSDA